MSARAAKTVAVVGSGVAGLVVAAGLCEDVAVTVFEADDRIGGHVHTVDVADAKGRHAVDTGFIVYNERNYPLFSRLLDRLGVATQPAPMSFSVHNEATGREYNGTSLNTLFAQRGNLFRPSFLRMLCDIVRFGRVAEELLRSPANDREGVAEFALRHRLSRAFVEDYLVPLGASLWSAPARAFREFPIRFVAEFLANHAMLKAGGRPTWRVVRGGSRTYVDALIAPFRSRIRTSSPVRRIERSGDGVAVLHSGGVERFDHVVLACHADQALAMLAAPTAAEREILAAFPYQRNDVHLHTDERQMPRARRAWGAWNYRVPSRERERASVTYDMNILQGLDAERTWLVSLNAGGEIAPDRIARALQYEHPIFTRGRAAAQARHAELLDRDRTSYCGAYWGFGFHEDGVRSAHAVLRAFGRNP